MKKLIKVIYANRIGFPDSLVLGNTRSIGLNLGGAVGIFKNLEIYRFQARS